MYIPKPIYRRLWKVWYKWIYLQSPAWRNTKEYYLAQLAWVDRHCYICTNRSVQFHHVNYDGLPKMKLAHLWSPLTEIDKKSVFMLLCSDHHHKGSGMPNMTQEERNYHP